MLSEIPRKTRALVVPGGPALSLFRLEKLLRTLKARQAGVSAVSARWVHFADLERELEGREQGHPG